MELVPELHHDQPKVQYVGTNGMIHLETSKPRQVYDDLTLRADPRPARCRCRSSPPNCPGSLGHHFFTESDGELKKSCSMIRLAHTQSDGLIIPPEPLKVEE